MTDIHKKREIQTANAGNAIVAGVAGILAGGLAVGAAMLMSDKKNQKKVSDAWVGTKEKIEEYIGSKKLAAAVSDTSRKTGSKV